MAAAQQAIALLIGFLLLASAAAQKTKPPATTITPAPTTTTLPAPGSVVLGLQCTANDVNLVGPGIVLQEPCDCAVPGPATVLFAVANGASSDRYCLAIYNCASTDPTSLDVIYLQLVNTTLGLGSTLPGKIGSQPRITYYTAQIPDYTCNNANGLTCYGAAPSGGQGLVFPRGEACPVGECCGTIVYGTSQQAPCPDPTPTPSKCRHQQVCVQGRGANLTCTDNCSPLCGGTSTLRACGINMTPPFTFSLNLVTDAGTSSGVQIFNSADPAQLCYDFTVAPPSGSSSYTATVTDVTHGCSRTSDPVSFHVANIDAPLLSPSTNKCTGTATITVTNCDPSSSIDYTYTVAGQSPVVKTDATKCSFTYGFTPGVDTSVTVDATLNGCKQTATTTISVPPTLRLDTIDFTQTDCTGSGTITAVPHDGSGSYSYAWRVDDGDFVPGTDTFSYAAKLDGMCHSITVQVTDSNNCVVDAAQPVFISQCVETTRCSP